MQRRKVLNKGVEGGVGRSMATTDRDIVLDSEFGIFPSMLASSQGTITITSKAFEKSPESPINRYSRSNIQLPMSQGNRGQNRAQLQSAPSTIASLKYPIKPPPIRVPSYVPMDVADEKPKSGESLIIQGKLSPSLLPEWAQRSPSPSLRSTSTSVKRQTSESGRIV
jgi:hypothetical protein